MNDTVDPSVFDDTKHHQGAHDAPPVSFHYTAEELQEAMAYLQQLANEEEGIVYQPVAVTLCSSDLNDVGVMLTNNEDLDDETATTVTDDSSDLDDYQGIEPEDVLRHFWVRGDIKYWYDIAYRAFVLLYLTSLHHITLLGSCSTADGTS